MKRNFVTNLALLLLLNLLVKPIYAFGIDVGVQNAVGATDYGNYFILLNFSIIFQIILDLGIENFSRREIARHTNMVNKYFSFIFPLKLTLGLVYFVFCSVIGLIIGWRGHEFTILLVLLFNQFLASFVLYFRANLGGMHMFRADSIVSVIDRFVVIVICGFLLLDPVTRNAFRIEWLIYSQTAAYLISASLAFSLVFSRTGMEPFRFNLRYYRMVLNQSLPYAVLILLMATYLRIDSVLVGKLLDNGTEQAGIYAQAFRIIEILSNYGYLFTLILLPVFSKMLKQGDPVEHLTRLSFTLLMVPALIAAALCLGYRHEIMELLYKQHLETSSDVLAVLTMSFLGICMTYIYGTLLTANGSLRQLISMALFAVVVNITLNLILIPRMGILGAAFANATTQLFAAFYQIILVRRIFKFKADISFKVRITFYIVLLAVATWLSRMLPLTWIYSALILVGFGIALSFLFRLIRPLSFRKVLENK